MANTQIGFKKGEQMSQKIIKTRKPNAGFMQRLKSPAAKPASILTSKMQDEIIYVKVDNIKPFRGQSRVEINPKELASLSTTIKRHGVRQPLTLIPTEEKLGFFEVVSGERRLRAATMAGLTKVPAILIHDFNQAYEISLIENIHRQDLHPVELGQAYQKLLETKSFSSLRDMAGKIGENPSKVSEYRQFANLPEEVRLTLIKKRLEKRSFLRSLVRAQGMKQPVEVLLRKIEEELKKSPQNRPTPSAATGKVRMKSLINISLGEDEAINFQLKGLKKCSKGTLKKLKGGLEKLILQVDEQIKSSK